MAFAVCARAQDAPEAPVDSVPGRLVDAAADRWSGKSENLSASQRLRRAEDAQKKSDWLEVARCAGILQASERSGLRPTGSEAQDVARFVAKSAPHLSAAQAACLVAWFGPTPEWQKAFGSAMVAARRWDEARAQALEMLSDFPTSEATNGALGVLQKAPASAASRVPAGATNSIYQVELLVPGQGDYEAYGRSLRAGFEIAVAEYNARAPLPLRLSIHDTEGEGWRAAQEGRGALDSGAGVLVGDVLTLPTLVLAGLANQTGVPLLSPSATDPKVGATGPLVFQTGAPVEAQATALARYAVQTGKKRVIAAPADLDSAFLHAFEAQAKQLGAKVVRVPASRGMRDFKPVAIELARVRADAVLLPLDPELAQLWVAGLGKVGIFLPFLATDAVDPQGFRPDTRKLLEGMTAVSSDFALSADASARVDSLAHAAYGLPADRFVRRGYLTGRLIGETIAAGADSPASFAAALRKRSGSLGFVHYDEAEASLPILTVRKGQLVRVH